MTSDLNALRRASTPQELDAAGARFLSGYLGIEVTHWAPGVVDGRLPLRPALFAPHGFVHGGTLVAFADSLCGYGCVTSLPAGADSFTTVDLSSSFVGAAKKGALVGRARQVHAGRFTQVWDAEISTESGTTVPCSGAPRWSCAARSRSDDG